MAPRRGHAAARLAALAVRARAAVFMDITVGHNHEGMLLFISIKKPASEEAGQSEPASHGELHSVTLLINNCRTS